jgi:hypothetical protein
MKISKWYNKFFIFPYISINIEYDSGIEIGWLKWSIEYIWKKSKNEIETDDDGFYCEVNCDFVYMKCSNQCASCEYKHENINND